MLTAVCPATDDSFVREANVPLSFSPVPADPQTRARGPSNPDSWTRACGPAVPHVPFPADHTVYLESRLSMQRLLWKERWARKMAASVYSFPLFSSEILKILFVAVKETSSSYVEVLFTIMYLDWHSSAHLLSKSATYSDILIQSSSL